MGQPHHRPLIPLFVCFSSGIALGHHLPLTTLTIAVLIAVLLGLLILWNVRCQHTYLAPLLLFLLIGMLFARRIPDPGHPPAGIKLLLQQRQTFLIGYIAGPPKRRLDRMELVVDIDSFRHEDKLISTHARMLLRLGTCSRSWQMGQWLAGQVNVRPIRNFNNPGGFDYRQYLADQNIWLKGYLSSDASLLPLAEPRGSPWTRLLVRIRSNSRSFFEAWLPQNESALYRALLLGERYALSSRVREQLYAAGVGHLLAISGLHLGMIAGIVFLICRTIVVRIPQLVGRWGASPVAALAALPISLGYASLTGMGLPIVRAAIMLACVTFALVNRRKIDLGNTLIVAAFIILTGSPQALFSPSFQLSFIAVGALVWLVPRIPLPGCLTGSSSGPINWRGHARWLWQLLLVSVVISVATAPAVVHHFHRFSPAAFIANPLIVPIVGFLVLPAGLFSLTFLPLNTQLAGFILSMGALGLDWILEFTHFICQLPWATIWLGELSSWQMALLYLVLLVPWLPLRRLYRSLLGAAVLVILVLNWMLAGLVAARPTELRVTYLDVGQGSSAVVEFPGKQVMLIDGGGFQKSSFDLGRH
ncbi:MAG: ComEC/Rec2 family competence protein, partial [Deltaproteobacteria bacterium]|nr:ComEC/Rec2 family competence protein [Deltaproteobacteria bacterium]